MKLYYDKYEHVLMTCPEISKYWTCTIVFNENTT